MSNKVSIKYVKKASKWCRTTFGADGKQKQEWLDSKPKEKENNNCRICSGADVHTDDCTWKESEKSNVKTTGKGNNNN